MRVLPALLSTVLFPVLFPVLTVCAGDLWPHFRGPGAQGHTDAVEVPLRWSEQEHVVWKTELPGEGWSSPVVAGGRAWMTTALEEGKRLHALCVDIQTGKLLHDVEVFTNDVVAPKHRRNSHASPSPVLEGGLVYVHFGAMGTACLDAQSGRKLWERRDLVVDFQNGAGGSPALTQSALLLTCDGMDQQYEVGLDKATGKTLWKTSRSAVEKLAAKSADRRKAYGTPVLMTIGGRMQTVSTASERLYGVDPATGRELWHVDYPGFSNVPLPVSDGEMLYVATGFMKPEVWGIKLAGLSGESNANVVWKQIAGAPAQASPLLVKDRLYIVSDGGIASCLNAKSGEIVWKERIGKDFAASPLFAAGRIYFFDCDGNTVVVEPGDQFKEIARNKLESGFMASPAVVGKALILRTKTHLYRIE